MMTQTQSQTSREPAPFSMNGTYTAEVGLFAGYQQHPTAWDELFGRDAKPHRKASFTTRKGDVPKVNER